MNIIMITTISIVLKRNKDYDQVNDVYDHGATNYRLWNFELNDIHDVENSG